MCSGPLTSGPSRSPGPAIIPGWCRRRGAGPDRAPIEWIVLRNRLSTLSPRDNARVGAGLQELARWLDFRCVEGLAERVIFRELYPRGLTAVDDIDDVTLGTRPTMSHVTARIEMQNLLGSILLGGVRSPFGYPE
jgi:chromosome partitioning protein